MENDFGDMTFASGSTPPSRLPTPASVILGHKRSRMTEDSVAGNKRPKHHTDRLTHQTIKREPIESEAFADHTQALTGPGESKSSGVRQRQRSTSATSVDSYQHNLPIVAVDVLGASSVTPAVKTDPAHSVAANIQDVDHDTIVTRDAEETITETRDKLMHRLRTAVGPEDLDTAVSTIESHHNVTLGRFSDASTAQAKLNVIRAYRTWTFVVSVQHLRNHEYVPQPRAASTDKQSATSLPR